MSPCALPGSGEPGPAAVPGHGRAGIAPAASKTASLGAERTTRHPGSAETTQGPLPEPRWGVSGAPWGQRCHPEHGGHSLARSSPFHLPLFPPGRREGGGFRALIKAFKEPSQSWEAAGRAEATNRAPRPQSAVPLHHPCWNIAPGKAGSGRGSALPGHGKALLPMHKQVVSLRMFFAWILAGSPSSSIIPARQEPRS